MSASTRPRFRSGSLSTNGFRRSLGVLGVLGAMASPALAQEAGPMDIEIPTVVTEGSGPVDGGGTGPDDELDLANVVQSAAKGVTTVQEAPAIVTVITADEIADRQFQTLDQILDTVPGYMRAGLIHSQFPTVTVRGTGQAVLLLHDSVSMFDSYFNVATFQRLQPLETIKRIETITGPGGVLWGANSFLGVVNVITKDAEDVDGVEVGGQLGDGNGDRKNGRVYMMAGLPDLMGGKAKLFVHSAFESYIGPGFQMPLHMFSAPLPQPNSLTFYGPLTTADPERSYLFNFFAKFTIGKVQVRVQAPYAERHTPMGFPGFVSRKDLAEDAVCDPTAPYDPMIDPNDRCIDRLRTSRDNQINFFERYVVLEYKARTAGGKAGLNLKAYGIQLVRAFPQLGILAPVPALLEGGLAFKFDATTYRYGGAFDGDFELPGNLRVNYGAEAFQEVSQKDVSRSIQGDGIEATFIGPYVLDRLPLRCPREPFTDDNGMRGERIIAGCPLTFAFPSDRTVGGIYANPQWRPSKKLILDAGARLQVSPESLGTQSYPLTRIFSGTAVWNFLPAWHLKLNYAEGFRPPVFNNVASNGEAVQLDGSRDLKVETSQSGQAEVNARIFKGERRIRELSFRLDYSYTKLKNLIQIVQGRYDNTADRAMHSGEALAKLYVQGGHRLELAYTYLQVPTRDKGLHKSFPNHMFHLAAMFNVIDDRLTMFTDLRVVGAMEDPNRLVEHRDHFYDMDANIPGTVTNGATGAGVPIRVGPTDLVLDRLPPAADLSLGFTLTPMEKLSIRGTVFNAFNARYYQPDSFYDYEPRLEFQPNPWEDWRAYISATYTH